MKQPLTLKQILAYENEHIIERYAKDYADNYLSPQQAYTEMLKFLWLGDKLKSERKKNPENKQLPNMMPIHHEMKEIDDMWHTFILFTKNYADFCEHYFDYFIHHAPNTSKEKPTEEEYRQELERYLIYVYDNLGEETVRLWFRDVLLENDQAIA